MDELQVIAALSTMVLGTSILTTVARLSSNIPCGDGPHDSFGM